MPSPIGLTWPKTTHRRTHRSGSDQIFVEQTVRFQGNVKQVIAVRRPLRKLGPPGKFQSDDAPFHKVIVRAGSLKRNTDYCVWVVCNFFDRQMVQTGLQGDRE